MNKIILIGNVSTDPEQHSTSNGKSVCVFNLAVNRKYSGANGDKVTDFFRINAWGKLGDNCARFVAKGRKVAVSGELQARMYDAKNGQQRMALDVQADEVEFLSPADNAQTKPAKSSKPEQNDAALQDALAGFNRDDLPF